MASIEKKIADSASKLSVDSQKSLLDFAQFLLSKPENIKQLKIEKAVYVAGTDGETVVGALKRLQRIYSMIDTKDIFNESSRLMTEHMLQGRDGKEVIEELQVLFEVHYQKIKDPDQ